MAAETKTADSILDAAAADGYAALARIVPLRPINSTEEHDRAIAQLNSLIDRHSELTPAEIDYMEVLGLIVGHYEDCFYGESANDLDADEVGDE